MRVRLFAACEYLMYRLQNSSVICVHHFRRMHVCERHFKPQYLRTTSSYTDVDGRTIEAPMKLTRLTPDALPTIFPDCPAYVCLKRKTREGPDEKKRRAEHELLQHAVQQSKVTYETESLENNVQNLVDITSRLERIRHKVFWFPTICDSLIHA